MLVSVIMAVYNGEAFVAPAIRSVLEQTHGDLELIVVDDGSTDATAEEVRKAAGGDPRLRLIAQANQGPAAARNTALFAAKGAWVFVLDADDLMLPGRIERQLAFIKAHPKVKIVGARARYINDKGETGRQGAATLPAALRTEADFNRYVESGEAIGLTHSTVAFHRVTLSALGGYRAAFRGAEDSDLWNRAAEQGHLILVQDDIVGAYRVHDGSIVGGQFRLVWRYHQWMRRCMRARRAGREEPSWEQVCADLDGIAWPAKVNRERKFFAKAHYRAAGIAVAYGRWPEALGRLAVAALLQPAYTLPRLLTQVRGSRGKSDG